MSKAGKILCEVCGNEFELVFIARYTSRANTKSGISTLATNEEPELYDTTDCPHCGCQRVLQPRKRSLNGVIGVDIPDIPDEAEEEEEEDSE